MDRALLALSAILGSTAGGLATIFIRTWLSLRTQGRRASIEAEVRKREALYGEFISKERSSWSEASSTSSKSN